METLASPRMLSCSLRWSCLVSSAPAFLAVCDVRIKGSRVSPGYHLMSHAKIKSSWQECRKSHSCSLISCNSRSRISLNILGKSVQPALHAYTTVVGLAILLLRAQLSGQRLSALEDGS